MNNVAERPLNGDVEDDDEDDGADLEAWERTYAEDRSWEALQEDESGLLRPIDTTAIYHAQYRRRLRTLAATAATARIQKGLIRYLYIVVDLSKVFNYRFCLCFWVVWHGVVLWLLGNWIFNGGCVLMISALCR